MNNLHLISMANQISEFFDSQPEREAAVQGVADHIRKFWDPRMRRKILATLDTQEANEMSALTRIALTRNRDALNPDLATAR